jgi:hypothetical protein
MWWWQFIRTCFNGLLIAALLNASFTSPAQAQSLWKVETVNYIDSLIRGTQKFELESSNVKPKVIEVKTHGGYEVVIYLAQISGTSVMYEVYNGAIYNRKAKQIIATQSWRLKNLSDPTSKEAQPIWQFNKNGSITVIDPEFPKPKTYPAP